MIGFPFDSHVTYDADGTPIYDRAVSSAPLRKLIKSLFSDGVLPNPSTNLQVSAATGMTVVVNPGFATCNGCLKLEETKRTLAVQASNTVYDRIDTVVLRLNDNDSERICDLYVKEGVPATSPVRPSLTRSVSVWELGLADLFIVKNSTAISNQRITDTRYESERCGIMSSISEFDTTTIYQQIQADLAGFEDEEQSEFMAWFEDIRGQLSEDAAGNLQNQIGVLAELKADIKTSLVNAFNWLVDKIGGTDISGIGDGTVTGAIDELHKNMDSLFKKIYPIGSIYMSVSDTNPTELFGGTWVPWGTGRVPVGVNASDDDFSTVEKTGGSKTQTLIAAIGAYDNNTYKIGYAITSAIKNMGYSYGGTLTSPESNIHVSRINHGTKVQRADGSNATTIQPYITCFMFKRTA